MCFKIVESSVSYTTTLHKIKVMIPRGRIACTILKYLFLYLFQVIIILYSYLKFLFFLFFCFSSN